MNSQHLSTKIFLDSGDPDETKKVLDILGFLDGQTTNPSLIAKKLNQEAGSMNQEIKLTEEELLSEYKKIVQEVSSLIPQGSVSIEVYSDEQTTAEQMLKQGKDMFSWIPNAHIKFPTTHEGLKAAEQAVSEGMRVNMTLVFTQEQAAAVYAATKTAGQESLPGFKNVFVSPFIGRLDDKGINGMDLIKNITQMYKNGDGHVMNLSASIRNLEHFLGSIANGADIITCPYGILEEWAHREKPVPASTYASQGGPDPSFVYAVKDLKPIPYKELDLSKPWTSFDISHELTDAGLKRFADDWKALLK
ncbi:transaldolase [Candidatus Roizmanbacteria bacterium]|nr:transaldolase [Candidatus Roizmanbacteria bacterium]